MSLPEGAELGSTKDPRQLIAGDPTYLDTVSTAVGDQAILVEQLADTHQAIVTPGWVGQAKDAYETTKTSEQTKWDTYAALLTTVGSALRGYAGALRTAQSAAADAIAKWEEGEQATRDAKAEYDLAVKLYEEAACAPPKPSSPFAPPSTTPTVSPSKPGPFEDPGEAIRAEAQQILKDAREALDEAGASAVEKLGGLPGARTEGSDDFLGADGDMNGPSFSWPWWEKTFGDDPKSGEDGSYSDDEHDSPFKLTLGNIEGEAYVYQTEGEFEDFYGDLHVNGDGSVTVLGADGSAEATIDSDGVHIGADGTLTLVNAEGEVTGQWGITEVSASGEAAIEATAGAHFTANGEGAHAGGEAFAGGTVGGDINGDAGGAGAGVNADLWYGFGIAGDGGYSFSDGAIHLEGSGGLAAGLGGHVGGELTLDFPELAESAGDLIDVMEDVLP